MVAITQVNAANSAKTGSTTKANGTDEYINIQMVKNKNEKEHKVGRQKYMNNAFEDLKSGKLKLVSSQKILGVKIPVAPFYEYTCSKDKDGHVTEKFVDVLARYGIDKNNPLVKAQFASCTSGAKYENYKKDVIRIPVELCPVNQ